MGLCPGPPGRNIARHLWTVAIRPRRRTAPLPRDTAEPDGAERVNARSAPVTRSRTVRVTTTSRSPASPSARAAMCTPIPPTSSSRISISPVWIAARIASPRSPHAAVNPNAHRSARVGASKVARMPSPVDFTKRPRNRSTSSRPMRSWRSRSRLHRWSPRSAACSVDRTMSVNRTVARTRSASCTACHDCICSWVQANASTYLLAGARSTGWYVRTVTPD